MKKTDKREKDKMSRTLQLIKSGLASNFHITPFVASVLFQVQEQRVNPPADGPTSKVLPLVNS